MNVGESVWICSIEGAGAISMSLAALKSLSYTVVFADFPKVLSTLLDLESALNSLFTADFDALPLAVGADVDDLKLPGSETVGLSMVGSNVGK